MSELVLANLVNGQLRAPVAGRYLDIFEPATGKVFARCPASTAADVDAAAMAAQAAASCWAGTPAGERAQTINHLASLLESRMDEFVAAESTDNGKPRTLARKVDIPRAVANLRYFAAAIQTWNSESHAMESGAINYTLRQPLGVVGCISPWNLPLYLFTWKVAPALATGNTVVAKPSEVTPVTAFMLSELAIEAGLPPGVLNIVHGTGPDVGQ